MEDPGAAQAPPAWRAFVAGSVAGVVSGAVGHPLDTVKLRLQTGRSMPHIGQLYRGLWPGLTVQLVTTSLLFGTYDYFRRNVDSALVAGGLAGMVLAPATAGLEAWKCQAQARTTVAKFSPFKGLLATALRCGLGNAAFFFVYEQTFAGTLAGLAYWAVALPIDVAKSRQQVSDLSLLNALPNRRDLFKGAAPVFLRAAPMSATCFYAYEATDSLLAHWDPSSSASSSGRRPPVAAPEPVSLTASTRPESSLYLCCTNPPP